MADGYPLTNVPKNVVVDIATQYLLEQESTLDTDITRRIPIETTQHLVTLRRDLMCNRPSGISSTLPKDTDLVIAGITPDVEEVIASWKNSGIIVARYGRFYGRFYRGASQYSRHSAAKNGYALDIPPDGNVVRSLLSDNRFLDAILERDEDRIRGAVARISTSLERPILVTPYLPKALEKRLK